MQQEATKDVGRRQCLNIRIVGQCDSRRAEGKGEKGEGGGKERRWADPVILDKTMTKARIRPVVMVKGSRVFMKQSEKYGNQARGGKTEDDFNHN